MTEDGGFSLNGNSAESFGIELLYSPGVPMMPEQAVREDEIPGRAGKIFFGADLRQRRFSLPCKFEATSAANLDELIRAFGAFLVDINGRPRTVALRFADDPSLEYRVRYSGQIPFERAWIGASKFTLNLVADDPYAYALAHDTTTEDITTSPGSFTVVGSGNVSTPAKICVTNTGASPISGFKITINHEVKP